MRRLSVTILAVAALAACGPSHPLRGSSSGTLALTHDDALLYAVDQDNEIVAVVDTGTNQRIASIPVGQLPERITLAPDDTAFVANRGDRSVSVFHRGDWTHVTRIPVGVEPVALQVSNDGKTLYVLNAVGLDGSGEGSLMAIDVGTLQAKWELPVGQEPRGLALLDGNRAVISHLKDGIVEEVDLSSPKVTRSQTGLPQALNRAPPSTGFDGAPQPLPDVQGGPAHFDPLDMSQLVVSPDGQRVYSTALFSSDVVLGTSQPDAPATGSTYGNTGGCGGGSVTQAGVVAFQASDLTPRTDSLTQCGNNEAKDFPATRLQSPNGVAIQGPAAMVVDPSGNWLFVANRETNNVAVMPTVRGTSTSSGFDVPASTGVRDLVQVGSNPTGLAINREGTRVYVHDQFDHDIQVLQSTGGAEARVVNAGTRIAIANDVLPPDVVAGRKLFFNALDERMSSVGIACASCHLEGREDGHVWNFAEGPRQTPSLAGRMTLHTAPFHWGGEHPTFDSFLTHTVTQRMGGAQVSAVMEQQLAAYIETIPLPDNPDRLAAPTEAQLRGAQVFHQAGCDGCHTGQALTNDTLADVGTFVRSGPVTDDLTFLARGLDTPSLLGVARTAPYLHDGSAKTLKERILMGKDTNLHGQTANLTDAQVDDLVAYLKSL